MKAAILHQANTPLEIADVAISKPRAREVLIRTEAAGVCHSDLHFMEGKFAYPLPTVLGHEAAGIVEAVGEDVHYVKPGDRVVSCMSAFCGHCEHCLTSRTSLCTEPELQRPWKGEQRLSYQGKPIAQFLNTSAFAEQMLVHEHAVVKVNDELPFDRAALLSCGVLTGTGAIFHSAKVRPGDTVAVIGCGGVGLAAINGAAIAGASRIIAIDRLPSKLEMAKEFGATDTILATDEVLSKQVRDMTNGGVHHSIEAIGLKPTCEQAFKMLRPGGTATIVGMIPKGVSLELHGPDFIMERKIQGSAMGSNTFRLDIPNLANYYVSGKLKLDELISGRIPLAGINDALEQLKTGEVARNVIMFDQ